MINKKSLWFLTLFSLILVLSVYYITMPSELLLTSNNSTSTTNEKENKIETEKENANSENKASVEVKASDALEAMRVESDSEMNDEIESLQVVLNDEKSSAEEKNKAYEKMQELNNNRALEESLEEKIKKEFSLDSYIKIDGNHIKVTINSEEHDTTLANKIMRSIQSNYDTSKYITVQFQK